MWKSVSGYEAYYDISDDGQVRSLGGRSGSRERILKQTNFKGYRRVSLSVGMNRKDMLVHRLVAEAFIPNPKNARYINHKDGDKSNNAIENLEWCSHRENMNHANNLGLVDNKGEKHPMHKLVEDEAKDIKAHTYRTDKIARELADNYNVSTGAVYDIWAGRTWRHI